MPYGHVMTGEPRLIWVLPVFSTPSKMSVQKVSSSPRSAACIPQCDKERQLAVVDTNFLYEGTRSFKLPLFLEEKDKYLKRAVNLIWRQAISGAVYLLTMKAEWTTGSQQIAMLQTAKHKIDLAMWVSTLWLSHPARTTWRQAAIWPSSSCWNASSHRCLVELHYLWRQVQDRTVRKPRKNRELNLWPTQLRKFSDLKKGIG